MADEFRTAHDTMGEMQIPSDALWGASTQRAVENFPVSGQPVPPEVVQAHAMLKWAAATANEEQDVVTADVADAIRRAADEVIAGDLDDHFPVDVFQTGSGTSTNMNV
ncbi:MAG: lyase family protein, partial [Nitriliruptor sp.]